VSISVAGTLDPEYVKARRVLLDALESLAPHRGALVLVGAQAIYLQVGAGELAVAPHTTDADLLIRPSDLPDSPLLGNALARGGFSPTAQPGIWTRDGVELDLLVPEAVAGPGRRGARLGPHGKAAARKVKGLEGALVESTRMELTALDGDDRRFEVRVAAPAALLVSKLHKIAERESRADRLADKDALDVLRLLQGVSTQDLAASIGRLLANAVSADVTRQSLELLRRLFGQVASPGTEMVVRATEGLEDPATIRASCRVLVTDLLEALGGGTDSLDPSRQS
jgi:hypothetical protein